LYFYGDAHLLKNSINSPMSVFAGSFGRYLLFFNSRRADGEPVEPPRELLSKAQPNRRTVEA